MIITITGNLGSGKSTIANALAKHFRLKRYSTGDFMREMAEKRKITLLELSKLAEQDKSVDKELDDRQKLLGKEEDDFVIDARLAGHFIPHSIKVFLKVDPEESARRIFNDSNMTRSSEKENTTLVQTLENINKRRNSELKRYKLYYHLDYEDMNNYDIVVDTTHIPATEVAKRVIAEIEKIRKTRKV